MSTKFQEVTLVRGKTKDELFEKHYGCQIAKFLNVKTFVLC